MSGILTGKRSVNIIFIYWLVSLLAIFFSDFFLQQKNVFSLYLCLLQYIYDAVFREFSENALDVHTIQRLLVHLLQCSSSQYAMTTIGNIRDPVMSHGHWSSVLQDFARNIEFSSSLRLCPWGRSSSPANYTSTASKLVFHSAWFEKLGRTFVNQFCSFRFCYMKWPEILRSEK